MLVLNMHFMKKLKKKLKCNKHYIFHLTSLKVISFMDSKERERFTNIIKSILNDFDTKSLEYTILEYVTKEGWGCVYDIHPKQLFKYVSKFIINGKIRDDCFCGKIRHKDIRFIFGHIIPTKAALTYLASIIRKQMTISIGSGCSLIEYLLYNKGCANIFSTEYMEPMFSFTKTIILSAENVHTRFSSAEVLLVIWSDASGYDYQALKEFKGHTVITILQNKEKYNRDDVGSEQFYNEIDKIFNLIDSYSLPYNSSQEWYPIIRIYLRK